MTMEQALAILDEIAMEAVRVEQCAVCRRSYFPNELNERGSGGMRVCARCSHARESSAPSPTPFRSQAA